MKRVIVFFVLILFLTSFAVASTKLTFKAVESDEANPNKITFRVVETQNSEDDQGNQLSTQTGTGNQGEETQIQARVLTQAQIQEIKQERKRIRIQEGECPETCTCGGSTVKCVLENGEREMTVTAGNSGNVIVQVKGVEGSTSVTLYKSEGKIYGDFDDETREVRVMPDQVQDKIRERIARELEDEEIELDENGVYQYRARKRVRILGLFRARARIRAEINSETGELQRIRNPWWAFLASEEGEPIVGASCGTVSPDSRNECCMNKGYDLYDIETNECVFSSE